MKTRKLLLTMIGMLFISVASQAQRTPYKHHYAKFTNHSDIDVTFHAVDGRYYYSESGIIKYFSFNSTPITPGETWYYPGGMCYGAHEARACLMWSGLVQLDVPYSTLRKSGTYYIGARGGTYLIKLEVKDGDNNGGCHEFDLYLIRVN